MSIMDKVELGFSKVLGAVALVSEKTVNTFGYSFDLDGSVNEDSEFVPHILVPVNSRSYKETNSNIKRFMNETSAKREHRKTIDSTRRIPKEVDNDDIMMFVRVVNDKNRRVREERMERY